MLSANVDYTVEFNANGKINLDISGWDVVDMHIITPTGTITFNGTNDAGAIQGVTDGNPVTATNWGTVQGVNQSSGSAATTTGSSGIFKFTFPSRFLQFTGAGVTVAKIIGYFSKIN